MAIYDQMFSSIRLTLIASACIKEDAPLNVGNKVQENNQHVHDWRTNYDI